MCKLADMQEALTPTSLSDATGISVPYASQLLNKRRLPSRQLALAIYHKTGLRFGPLESLSDDDIRTLARIEGVAA